MGRPLNEVAFGLVAPEEIPDLEKPLPSKNVLFSLDETLRKRCSPNINSLLQLYPSQDPEHIWGLYKHVSESNRPKNFSYYESHYDTFIYPLGGHPVYSYIMPPPYHYHSDSHRAELGSWNLLLCSLTSLV